MQNSPRIYEWEATLSVGPGSGAAGFLAFPWDPKKLFGKGNLVPVCVDFEGILYRGDIANMGDGPCIVMLKSIRTQLGKQPGDTVRVRLWHDTEPRVVEAPDDLVAAWRTVAAASDFWAKLSPGNRRLYVKWFDDAKKAETRQARIAKAVERLAAGQKTP